MKNRRNYYRLLQVQPDAPLEIIHASYRTLMRELKKHPDLGGEHWNASILNEAYETLRDSDKRIEYDKKLFESYTKKLFSKESFYKQNLTSIFCPFCKRPLARKSKPDKKCPICSSYLQSKSEESFNQECRRSVIRMKKFGKLQYYCTWSQKGHEAEMVDLSPKGMRFNCAEKLKINSIIKLNSTLLTAIAKVTNSQQKELKGEIFYTVGVQFLTVSFAETKGSFFDTLT